MGLNNTNMPVVNVFISADAESPNFLIKVLAYDWMTVGHVKRRVNEVLSMADSWDGDGEFCAELAPVWVDGFDGDDDSQCLVGMMEGQDMSLFDGFGWDMESDELIIVEVLDEFDPY